VNILLSCIGRRGYLAEWFREALGPDDRIIGTSNTDWTPGFAACDRGVVLPDVADERYLPAVLQLIGDEDIDVLLSLFDPDVTALAAARPALEALGVAAFIPDAETARMCFDKVATADLLAELDIPGPRTWSLAASARIALDDGGLDFPVVVKDRFGGASHGVSFATDAAELEVALARSPSAVVQEALAGVEHSLDVLTGLDGEVRSVVVKQKRSMRAGETDQAVTVYHPGAVDVGLRLGRALRAYGPLDVDIFIDDDRVAVLELNARFGGAYPAAHLAGADFPGRILDMARGRPDTRDLADYELGVSMMKDYRIRRGPSAD
jgi:carbamoyl-phosphate synthase large subunit